MTSETANGEKKGDLFEQIFQAIPSPAFVVNGDIQLLRWNAAAANITGGENELFLRRGGEALHCINSQNPGGCGRSAACQQCVIRNSVQRSQAGNQVHRNIARLTLQQHEQQRYDASFLVTTAPIAYQQDALTLLILEDVSELLQLRALLPICASCKKIRDDQDYWHSVEEYLGKQLDIRFTHGICPDCLKKEYPDRYEEIMARAGKRS